MSARSKKVRAVRRAEWREFVATDVHIDGGYTVVPTEPGWRAFACGAFKLPLVAPAQGSRRHRQPVYYPDRSGTVDAVYRATTARTVRPSPTLLREYRARRLARRIADAERLGLHTLARVLRVTAPHGLSLP